MGNAQRLSQISNRVQKDLNVLQKQSTILQNSLSQFNSMVQVLTKEGVTEHRGAGRPRKEAERVVVTINRRPGRPKKEEETIIDSQIKRGPGRPRLQSDNNVKNDTKEFAKQDQNNIVDVKRGPGRPKVVKEEEVVKLETTTGRGRPSMQDVLTEPLSPNLKAEIKRIEENQHHFNQWSEESADNKDIWKIENATYLGVVEGFYSSGTSGRYGITTRVYVNPNSHLVPEDLKEDIDTSAVNRIRYVENKEEGTKYIEKQKIKLLEEFFNDTMPKIIKDHGKKGSVYAFHLDSNVRKQFNKLKVVYDNKYTNKTSKDLVKV
jgi:hypothetical protein